MFNVIIQQLFSRQKNERQKNGVRARPAPLPMTGKIKPPVANIFLSPIFLSFDLDLNNYCSIFVNFLI